MNLADELKKLEGLRWNGTLTEEEFERAKAALLAKLEEPPEGASEANGAVAEKLGEQLAEIRYQSELARLDREWEAEKEQYMTTDKHGRQHVPTASMGWGIAIIGGIFGAIWTLTTFAMTREMAKHRMMMDDGFDVMSVLMPLMGVAVTVGAVWVGIHTTKKAETYNKALAAYRARRAAMKPEDFR